MTDEQQIEAAIQKQAVTFTRDVDFIKIARRKHHLGIIYVHQQKLTVGECIERLKTIAETKTKEECATKSSSCRKPILTPILNVYI